MSIESLHHVKIFRFAGVGHEGSQWIEVHVTKELLMFRNFAISQYIDRHQSCALISAQSTEEVLHQMLSASLECEPHPQEPSRAPLHVGANHRCKTRGWPATVTLRTAHRFLHGPVVLLSLFSLRAMRFGGHSSAWQLSSQNTHNCRLLSLPQSCFPTGPSFSGMLRRPHRA